MRPNWKSKILLTVICLCTIVFYAAAAQATEQYVVKAGDTLWSLAQSAGTSVDDLKAHNNLSCDSLKIGQVLSIPASGSRKITANRSSSKPVSRGGYRSVVDLANNFIGVRYVSGGMSPSGFDCSGFTSYVYGLSGMRLPRVASGQYSVGTQVSRSALESGDLVFFNTCGGISHVGIYVGGNRFIHASTSRGVRVDNLSDSYWGPRYVGAKRVR